jgi:hypothetical protein
MASSEQRFRLLVSGFTVLSGAIVWDSAIIPLFSEHEEEGLVIRLPFSSEVKRRYALTQIRESLEKNGVEWIREKSGGWVVDLDKLFAKFPNLEKFPWLKGMVEPTVEVDVEEREVFGKIRKETIVQFLITNSEIEASMPKRIFLSHKGVNKPLIRDYFDVLRSIGFDPWLDEDAMVAGVPLERALLAGMKESCAAVFFITPEYRDENYLASEVNYAMAQKREKGERFSIITLVLEDSEGNKGVVPELLRQYVWKEPATVLLGLKEILRALPIQMTQIVWKPT